MKKESDTTDPKEELYDLVKDDREVSQHAKEINYLEALSRSILPHVSEWLVKQIEQGATIKVPAPHATKKDLEEAKRAISNPQKLQIHSNGDIMATYSIEGLEGEIPRWVVLDGKIVNVRDVELNSVACEILTTYAKVRQTIDSMNDITWSAQDGSVANYDTYLERTRGEISDLLNQYFSKYEDRTKNKPDSFTENEDL